MQLYFDDLEGPAGTPIFLLAGLASDALSWFFQREPFQAQRRLIMCDNRGVGRSPKPPGPYSIDEMVEDAVAVLDRLGVERVHVVGHSMGGAIAQLLAARYPERVERLVLACTFSKMSGRSRAVIQSWSCCVAEGVSTELLALSLFPWLYSERFLEQPGQLAAATEALGNHPYPLDAQGVAGQVAALLNFDSRAELSKIQAPTLVLAAQEDLLVPTSVAQQLTAAIPIAESLLLAETGHSCMLETPKAFQRAVLTFLLKAPM